MWQYVKFSSVGTTVKRFYADADILRRFFGVLDKDIEISIAIEDAGIQQLELRFSPSRAVFLDQLPVRKFPLRVFVKHMHVAVSGDIFKVKPILFRVLTVISFGTGEPEHTLFQNGVMAVPKGQSEHKQLITVADPRNAILAPAVGLADRLIMRKKIPGVPIGAVVLAYASPGPVTDVRSPSAPAVEAGFS